MKTACQECVNSRKLCLMVDASCQEKSLSQYSPCTVNDNEIVLRSIFSPQHIDADTGDITPNAWSDMYDKGMSVNRRSYASEQDIISHADLFLERKRADDKKTRKDIIRSFYGILPIHVGQLRKLQYEAGSFCVFDTALEDNIAHADVCACGVEAGLRPPKQVRAKMVLHFGQAIVRPEEINDYYQKVI